MLDFITLIAILGAGFCFYIYMAKPEWYTQLVQKLKDKYQTK